MNRKAWYTLEFYHEESLTYRIQDETIRRSIAAIMYLESASLRALTSQDH